LRAETQPLGRRAGRGKFSSHDRRPAPRARVASGDFQAAGVLHVEGVGRFSCSRHQDHSRKREAGLPSKRFLLFVVPAADQHSPVCRASSILDDISATHIGEKKLWSGGVRAGQRTFPETARAHVEARGPRTGAAGLGHYDWTFGNDVRFGGGVRLCPQP